MFHPPEMLFLIFVFCSTSGIYSLSWNFSKFHIFDDTTLGRFAVWRNRAFFAVPRYTNASNWRPTLLEAPFYPDHPPELQFLLPQPSQFPANSTPAIQPAGQFCKNLISIVGLDTDSRGRLWVLDSPRTYRCSAKVVIFDLRKNEEIARSSLPGVPKEELSDLVIDPVVGLWGYRGYIGDPGDDSIVTYNLGHAGQRKWWRIHLLPNNNLPRIVSMDLAICRKNRLFLTGGNSPDLFSINLEALREEPHNSSQITKATYHGVKMGVSSGLFCDTKGGLHYFLVSEYASVRWDTQHDLKASSHAVLLQTAEAPSISDYTIDTQRNIWGLVNIRHPFLGKDTYPHPTEHLPNRVIRVFKPNKFFN